jgi:hypothetical protein
VGPAIPPAGQAFTPGIALVGVLQRPLRRLSTHRARRCIKPGAGVGTSCAVSSPSMLESIRTSDSEKGADFQKACAYLRVIWKTARTTRASSLDYAVGRAGRHLTSISSIGPEVLQRHADSGLESAP